MATAQIDVAATEEFGGALAGRLIRPADDDYDQAREVHNGMIDRRPALIVRCQGVQDIVDAVNFAREHGLEVAVRGGGHNVGGRGVTEDGLMIDLADMRAVVVDPVARTAVAQGGATWADFNRETQVYGLASTGGVVSTTGVAGLTLGGGLGWLMGRHGMAVDNLRSVELVTASGEVVRASADSTPDLFWALRGGGGNFGVAASLEFDLHEVGPTVLGGVIRTPSRRPANCCGSTATSPRRDCRTTSPRSLACSTRRTAPARRSLRSSAATSVRRSRPRRICGRFASSARQPWT